MKIDNDKKTLMKISLPMGGELEVECVPEFFDTVREKLNIPNDHDVTKDDIRMFIYGALKSGTDKVEKDLLLHQNIEDGAVDK